MILFTVIIKPYGWNINTHSVFLISLSDLHIQPGLSPPARRPLQASAGRSTRCPLTPHVSAIAPTTSSTFSSPTPPPHPFFSDLPSRSDHQHLPPPICCFHGNRRPPGRQETCFSTDTHTHTHTLFLFSCYEYTCCSVNTDWCSVSRWSWHTVH